MSDYALGGDRLAQLTFREFSEANRTRCEAPNGFNHPLAGWSMSDWFVAVMGELGEAANIVKKLNRVRDGVPGNKQTPEELRDRVRQELGDVFVYLDLIAQSLGFSIADAAVEVFNEKSVEIGYPAALRAAGEPPPQELTKTIRLALEACARNDEEFDSSEVVCAAFDTLALLEQRRNAHHADVGVARNLVRDSVPSPDSAKVALRAAGDARGWQAMCTKCASEVPTMSVLKYHRTKDGDWCVGSGSQAKWAVQP